MGVGGDGGDGVLQFFVPVFDRHCVMFAVVAQLKPLHKPEQLREPVFDRSCTNFCVEQ